VKRNINENCIKKGRNDQYDDKSVNRYGVKRQTTPSLWDKLREMRLTQKVS